MSGIGTRTFCLLAVAITIHASDLLAEEPNSDSTSVTEGFFALPVELEGDFGAANGDATLLRISPIYGSPSANNWKIIHLNMLTIADAPAMSIGPDPFSLSPG